MKNIVILFVTLIIGNKLCAQWSTIYNGGSDFFFAAHFTDKNTGYVGGVFEISKTTDGGATWVNQYTSTNSSIESIYFVTPDTGYAVGGVGSMSGNHEIIMKTVDGGNSWIVKSYGHFDALYSVYFTSVDTGHAVGINGIIVKTVDGGQTWTSQTIGFNNFFTSVHFTNANTGYVVGYNGQILKTTDAGITWVGQSAGTTDHLLKVYFTSPNVGYICGGLFGTSSVMFKTINAGITWTPLALPAGVINLHAVRFINANDGIAAGDYGTIITTNDAGVTWTQSSSGVTSRLFYIDFPVQDTGYIVGEYKVILKYISTPTGIKMISGNNDIAMFPNPTTGIITLNFDESDNTPKQVYIYNAIGDLIISTELKSKMQINLDNQPAGIYFLKAGDVTKKIIKQ